MVEAWRGKMRPVGVWHVPARSGMAGSGGVRRCMDGLGGLWRGAERSAEAW